MLAPAMEALRYAATPGARFAPELAAQVCNFMYAFAMDQAEVARGGTPQATHDAVEAGAVEALIAIVNAYPPCSPQTGNAFSALYSLAANDPDAAVRAASLGTVEAVAAALRCPEADAALEKTQLSWHASLLGALLSNKQIAADTAARCARCGVVRPLLAAAQRHLSYAFGVQPVATLLWLLAFQLPDDERLDALQLLSAMLSELADDVVVAAEACKATEALLLRASPEFRLRYAQSAAGLAAMRPLVAALRAHAERQRNLALHGCCALALLCRAAPGAAPMAAVRCGLTVAFEAFPSDVHGVLRDAEKEHDAQPRCEPGEGEGACARCAEQRLTGALCGAPGCFARKRPCSVKALLCCAACRVAAYCGAEHQRAAWADHKQACRAAVEQKQRKAGASS